MQWARIRRKSLIAIECHMVSMAFLMSLWNFVKPHFLEDPTAELTIPDIAPWDLNPGHDEGPLVLRPFPC